jgi:TatA/E family protein of Tat protein translocase
VPLLLVFESIGTPELLLIVIAALVLFGPRKLPEIGRMLGKTMGEFRRASEDFKRTWEMEVELETAEKQRQPKPDVPEVASDAAPVIVDAETSPPAPTPLVAKPAEATVARGSVTTETMNEEVTSNK